MKYPVAWLGQAVKRFYFFNWLGSARLSPEVKLERCITSRIHILFLICVDRSVLGFCEDERNSRRLLTQNRLGACPSDGMGSTRAVTFQLDHSTWRSRIFGFEASSKYSESRQKASEFCSVPSSWSSRICFVLLEKASDSENEVIGQHEQYEKTHIIPEVIHLSKFSFGKSKRMMPNRVYFLSCIILLD